MSDFTRALFAEAFGTAALLLFGTGTLSHAGVSLAFGLIILILIPAFGPVSGAHLNPAVTVAFWAAGRFEGRRVLPYTGAQVLGGLAGTTIGALEALEALVGGPLSGASMNPIRSLAPVLVSGHLGGGGLRGGPGGRRAAGRGGR